MVETAVAAVPVSPEAGSRRVSPAAYLGELVAAAEVTGARGVGIRELPFFTMIGRRVVPGTPAAERIREHLGAARPARCGAVTAAPMGSVLWLSPDEYLVVSADDPAKATQGQVRALGGEPGSATDLSANRTTFELAGPKAREVLEKGWLIDAMAEFKGQENP